MDRFTVIDEVRKWPVSERMDLIESVWDEIVKSGQVPNLTAAQTAEIDRRVLWLEANPDKLEPWEEVEAYVHGAR